MKEELRDPKLKKIIEILQKEFNPKRLFLFGSRANGHSHESSDYDFVVVVEETNKNRHENMGHARKAIWEQVDVSADVFVYDQNEFDEWKDELSSIPETALNTGVEIPLEQF